MIQVKRLSKHFGGVYALKDCTLDVKEGKITSIIGPNGAGKTTLFNTICSIIQPDHGEIWVSGKKTNGLATHQIARLGISRTFQQARLFRNMKVKDNLRIAKWTTDKEIQEALHMVKFPLSMNTIAGELSYGQTRLVELARALIAPHTILMLDEPTAGVNPKVRQEIRQILLGLKKQGKTIVLIEHDMEFVMSISDEVIVMAEGAVLTRGTPKQVQENKKVLEVYLGK
ncbi:MAG: ABC transporter ATP-binding protein [Nanoarchaeota archaeon]